MRFAIPAFIAAVAAYLFYLRWPIRSLADAAWPLVMLALAAFTASVIVRRGAPD